MFVGLAAPSKAQQHNEVKTFSGLQFNQKEFIAQFTGIVPDDAGTMPPSRSTQKQRSLAANYLVGRLKQMGLPVKRHVYQYPNMHFLLDLVMPPYKGQNIISHIPATTPSDQYIVIGAHYDSVRNSPGANDNASGVAIALSTAQAIMKFDSRNVHFLIVFFDHEEDGSSGSKAYVRKLLEDKIKIHSMHNIDMIGWDGDNDRVIEVDLPTDQMENIYRDAAKTRHVEISRVSYNSADHLSFRNEGIDAVCISEEYGGGDSTPHYHKPTDTIDGVNFEYLASNNTCVD